MKFICLFFLGILYTGAHRMHNVCIWENNSNNHNKIHNNNLVDLVRAHTQKKGETDTKCICTHLLINLFQMK